MHHKSESHLMCQSFTCPFVLTPQTNDLQVLKRYTSDLWNPLNGPYHAKRLPKLWIWRACMLCYIYFDSKLMHLDIIYINLTQKILMKKLQCLNSYFFSSQFEQKKDRSRKMIYMFIVHFLAAYPFISTPKCFLIVLNNKLT